MEIYSNAGALRKRWHLEFSSMSDENSLVPLRFAPSESVPKWNIFPSGGPGSDFKTIKIFEGRTIT